MQKPVQEQFCALCEFRHARKFAQRENLFSHRLLFSFLLLCAILSFYDIYAENQCRSNFAHCVNFAHARKSVFAQVTVLFSSPMRYFVFL